MSEDKRIVVGARCTWWGSISEIKTRQGLPVCPHCLNVLYEFESQEIWDRSVSEYEKKCQPGYRAMIDWGKGKCFPNFTAMKTAYEAEKTQ